MHHAFLYISLPSLHDYDVKMPNYKFYGGRKQATTVSLSKLECGPQEINSREIRLRDHHSLSCTESSYSIRICCILRYSISAQRRTSLEATIGVGLRGCPSGRESTFREVLKESWLMLCPRNSPCSWQTAEGAWTENQMRTHLKVTKAGAEFLK